MADNATLDPSTGTRKVASDDLEGVLYERIKVADGTADSVTPAPKGNGTASDALRVTLASDSTGQVKLAAGTETVGEAEIGAATTAIIDLAAAEDQARVPGKTGAMGLAVRGDTPGNLSGTDSDYEPPQVSAGKLWRKGEGEVADGSASTSRPAIIGGEATDTSLVDEADAAYLPTDRNRRTLVSARHPESVSGSLQGGTAATTEVLAAPGVGRSIYLTDAVISAGGAQTVEIVEATAGSARALAEPFYVPANSTVRHTFSQPIPTNENVNVGVVTTAAQNYSVTLSGYKGGVFEITGGGGVTDPDFADVTALFHFDGADASTTFTDSSGTGNMTQGATTAEIDTAQSKWGGSSLYVTGSGYISRTYSTSDDDWFVEDYTVEAWVRASTWAGWSNATGNPNLIGNTDPASPSNYWSFGPNASGNICFYYFNGTATLFTSSATLATGSWHHIAFCYTHSSGAMRLFYNGNEDSNTATKSGTPQSGGLGLPLTVGRGNNASINGHVDELRVTKGTARYSGSYTVPTAAFPDS